MIDNNDRFQAEQGLATGQVLQDRYQLQEPLSDRRDRQTWLATDLEVAADSPKLVVVKLLAVGAKWQDLKLFEREAQVLKQLHHPRIPQYHDYFQIDDPNLWVGLVESYVPGASLKAMLNQGKRFTQAEIQQIAQQVLQILKDLHSLSPPLFHRDIKPSNLILTPDRHIYLVDFGAVQNQAITEGDTFTVVGTYGYTPMEQFGGKAVPASDLYALGATLIHLLTGSAPADLVQSDLSLKFSDRVTISSDLTAWLQRITNPNLAQRFNSAEQALEELKNCRPDPVVTLNPGQQVQTRVLIHESPTQLEIQIPPKWVGEAVAWPERLLGLGVILVPILTLLPVGAFIGITSLVTLNFPGLGIGLLLSIAGLVICVLGGYLLKRNFEATQICGTQTLITVRWKLFGWTYKKQQWQMDQLQSLYSLSLGPTDTTVMLQIRGQDPPHSIAEKLTLTESEGLIQAINNWTMQRGKTLPMQH